MGEREWMAQRNQFRSLLSRLNTRDASHFQRIAFRQRLFTEELYRAGRHLDECFCARGPYRLRLFSDVNHARAALFVQMRQLILSRSHTYSISRNCALAPASRLPLRRGIMIKAFARASPAKSDEPFHGAV